MEEQDIIDLIEAGYLYNKLEDCITDAEGNYLESVQVKGKTLTSALDKEGFDYAMEESKVLESAGYTPESDNYPTDYNERQRIIGKVKAENFKNDPTSTTITQQDIDSPQFNEGFNEYVEQAQERYEFVNTSPKAMVQAQEEGTIYAEMEDDKDKIAHKKLLQERAALLESDSSYKKEIQDTADGVELSAAAALDPKLKIGASLLESFSGLFPETFGMENDKNKTELERIDRKIKKLEDPITIKEIEKLDDKISELEQNATSYYMGSTEIGEPLENQRTIELAISKLKAKRNSLSDTLDETVFDSNIFRKETAKDLLSFGINDLVTEVPRLYTIKTKIADGEELTPAESVLAEVYAIEANIDGLGVIKPSWTQTLSSGLVHSIGFMRGGALGRNITKKLIKETAEGATKSTTRKFLEGTSNVVVQAIAHPATYSSAVQKYDGDIVMDEKGNITTEAKVASTLVRELESSINILDGMDKSLMSPEDKAKVLAQLNEGKEMLNNVKRNAPPGLVEAGVYGFYETGVEVLAETYFLKGLKMGGKLAKKVTPTKAQDYLIKAGKNFEKINDANNPLRRFFNEKYGGTVPGTNLIGGNLEELGEEVFVQLMPPIETQRDEKTGERLDFFEGWAQQASHIFTSDFITQTVAQTLIMGKGAEAIGYASQFNYGLDFLTNAKDAKDKLKALSFRKNTKKHIRALGNTFLSEKEFSDAFMKTGKGSFNMQDYNNTIAEMEAQGDFQGAMEYGRDLMFKQAVTAHQTGNGEAFEQSLNKALKNKNLSANTKANITSILALNKKLKDINGKYRNGNTIMELEAKEYFLNNSIEKATTTIQNDLESSAEVSKAVDENFEGGKTLTQVLETIQETGDPELVKKLADVAAKLSDKGKNYIMLETAKFKMEDNISEIRKMKEVAVSEETQNSLKRRQGYLAFFGEFQANVEGGTGMTLESFKEGGMDKVEQAYEKSKGEKLTAAELREVNDGIISILEQKEAHAKAVKEAIAKKEAQEKLDEENKKKTPEQVKQEQEKQELEKKTSETLETLNAEVQKGIQIIGEQSLGFEGTTEITNEEGEEEIMPDFMFETVSGENNASQEALKSWASHFSNIMGRTPSFRDLWESIISVNGDNKNIWSPTSLELVGRQWEAAGLGTSEWASILKNEYNDLSNITRDLFNNNAKLFQTPTTDVAEHNTEIKKTEAKQKAEVEDGPINPVTNKPIPAEVKEEVEEPNPVDEPVDITREFTTNQGKTSVVTTKGNYASIKYRVTIDKDGNEIYHTKIDSEENIPTMKTDVHLALEELLHPDKNQPGDILGIRVTTEEDWDNPKILVSSTKENGTVKTVSTFGQWIKRNQPKNMTLEEFKQTPEFKNKVPIFYTDASGNDVMYVPDTDWHNPMSIKDPNVGPNSSEKLNINTPSSAKQREIEEGRKNAQNLRDGIFDGSIQSVTIESKSGSKWITIPPIGKDGKPIPPKRLSEVAKDNLIFQYNGDSFLGLDKSGLGQNMVILNQEDIINSYNRKKNNSKGTISPQNVYLSPIYKKNGIQYYTAIEVLMKNDDNKNEAFPEDVQTVKLFYTAHTVLSQGKDMHGMTVKEAKEIRRLVNEQTGVNISSYSETQNLADSMIALVSSQGKITSRTSKDQYTVPVTRKGVKTRKPGFFLDALLSGEFTPVQNIRIGPSRRTPLTLTFTETETGREYQVKKSQDEQGNEIPLWKDYDAYLKDRLSSSVMGYNMGTEQDPKFTISIQPIIKVEPIVNEKVKSTQQLEQTKPEVTVTTGTELTEAEIKQKEAGKVIVTTSKEGVEKTEVTEVVDDNKVAPEHKEMFDQVAEALRSLNALNTFESQEFSDEMPPTMEDVDIINEALNTVSGLSSKSQLEVIKNLAVALTRNYNKEVLTVGELNKITKKEFNKLYGGALEKLNESLAKARELEKLYPNSSAVRQLLANVEVTIEDTKKVMDNYNSFFAAAITKVKKEGIMKIEGNTDTEEEILEEALNHQEEELKEKNFYKSSNEDIHKNNISKELKQIFYDIYIGDTGFLGTPIPVDYDLVYNSVATYLATTKGLTPTFKGMIEALKQVDPEGNSWIKPLIEKLEKAPKEVQNGFVSSMYKYSANARFVMFTKSKTGVDSALWFSNANNIERKIRETWKNNFKRSPLVKGNLLDSDKLKEASKEFENNHIMWAEGKDQEGARKWLANFGIVLSDKTWDDLLKGNLVVKERGVLAAGMPFKSLFISNEKFRGKKLFHNLYKFAEQNKNKSDENLNFTTNDNLTPLKDMGNILKGLIPLEVKHNKSLINITRRDGDKTVSEIVYPSFYLDNIDKLIDSANGDKAYIDKLMNLDYSKDSLLLELLKEDSGMGDIFDYGEVGLMSMKNQYEGTPRFSNIDQISNIDYIFHQRSMFQDLNTEKISVSKDLIPLRVAVMSTPTNSDKGRMMLMKTAVYDLYASGITVFNTETEDLKFEDDLKEMLFKRLVNPELRRIIGHTDKGVKGYDKGAKRFNALPTLNTMVGKSGITAIEFLEKNKPSDAVTIDKIMEDFKEEFFDVASVEIENTIQAEATANIKEVDDFNIQEGNDISQDHINNAKYKNKSKAYKTTSASRRAAELDYIINSYVHITNTMQAIAGDPAVYFAKGDPTTTDKTKQIEMSMSLGTNMGKRLALMIAPGTVLAESKDEKYIQLFLKDADEVAPNIDYLIDIHYGKDTLNDTFESELGGTMTYGEALQMLKDGKIDMNGKDFKSLKLKYEKVADFMSIESTDGQEYTTLKEHLRVMEGLGRISPEKVKEILDTVARGETLSKADMEVLLQPMKPVYTGADIKDGFNRVTYIKCSSFPLIPDLVKGTPLEGLMNKMEEIEKNSGHNVRASYQSANKLGANVDAIDPLNAKDLAKLDVAPSGIPLNSNLLSRENFKIQQDVPYKSDKPGEDKVSMGTQIFKLLLGDGVAQILDANLKKGETGIKQEFFETFSTMVTISRKKLLDELGLDDDYNASDPAVFTENLQKLLIKEAEERNFSENDIKALGIPKTTKNGKETYTYKVVNGKKVFYFNQPLWFSGNSDKIETMLNAIINNRVFKQKIPGNAAVVGSNSGITLKTQADVAHSNKIVHIGDYKGGTLEGNQVLAPCKIKVGGKILNLHEKDENGEYIYIVKNDNGGYSINEEKIDPELFKNFTFRTPTSSHGSGSSIEIVGFLPDTMGDLMITPSNFVPQMGQDFDIDKLTNYQYYHYKDKNGKIKRIDKEYGELVTKELQDKIVRLEKGLANKENSLQDEAEVNSLMAAIFGDKVFSNAEISNLKDIQKRIDKYKDKLEKLPDEIKLKLAKNNFIDIHNRVFNSSNKEIQAKINKVLSMDTATEQAEAIDEIVSNSSGVTFSLLSPAYQMKKLISGSTGSSAIGIYAKGVTFNSLAQQSDKRLRLMSVDPNEGTSSNKEITIGDITSNGEFGNINILSIKNATDVEKFLARSIAVALDERVNTGTDNEKAQILGRVGITDGKNVAVDNLLTQLGIDLEIKVLGKGEKGLKKFDPENKFHKKVIIGNDTYYYTQYSLPYLLHSQPIVKEYFKRLKNSKAIVGRTKASQSKAIYEQLVGEYNPNKENRSKMTGESLANQLEKGNINTNEQKDILHLYMELMEDAESLKELQDIIDMSNLGKSMWESKENIEKFKSLADTSSDLVLKFGNATELLGVFEDTKSEGNLDLGEDVFFRPTTNQGTMVGTAVSLGRNLFYDFYPYYDPYIESYIDYIAENTSQMNDYKIRETIFQEIKKYISTNTANGIFSGDPQQEKQSLLFNSEGNTSLSTFIADILNTPEDQMTPGIKELMNNHFLSNLEFVKGEDGAPDIIKFDNTAAGNLSEEDLHIAFKELLVSEQELPSREDGTPYSVRQLGQELVSYSHLTGGIVSQASQFHKFIPMEYYQQLTTKIKASNGAIMEFNILKMMQAYDPRVIKWGDRGRLKFFEKQFFQNNPDMAQSMAKKNYRLEIEGQRLLITNPKIKSFPEFIKVSKRTKSKKKADKTHLYEHMGNGVYTRVEVLGSFGMPEYNYTKPITTSLIASSTPVVAPATTKKEQLTLKPLGQTAGTKFALSNDDTPFTALEKVLASPTADGKTKQMAQTMLEIFKDSNITTTIKVDPTLDASGVYIPVIEPNGNTITINPNRINVESTFVHEFIHAVTSDYLNKYVTHDGELINPSDTPKEILELQALYKEYKDNIIRDYNKEYNAFLSKVRKKQAGEKGIKLDRGLENSAIYATLNLKEFLAVTLTNNEGFLEVASKMKTKSGMNFKTKFTKVLQRLLNAVAGKDTGNLATQILNYNLGFVEQRSETFKTPKQEVSGKEVEKVAENLKKNDPTFTFGGLSIVNPAEGGTIPSEPTPTKEEETVNIYAGSRDNIRLSNFASRPFTSTVEGMNPNVTFDSVEEAFQKAKFYLSGEPITNQPLDVQKWLEGDRTYTSSEHRKLGRKVKMNPSILKYAGSPYGKTWDEASRGIMKDLMKESFDQNPEAKQALLDTGNAALTHKDKSGKEQDKGRFSEVLTEIREEYKKEVSSPSFGDFGIVKPDEGFRPDELLDVEEVIMNKNTKPCRK